MCRGPVRRAAESWVGGAVSAQGGCGGAAGRWVTVRVQGGCGGAAENVVRGQ